ncbi:MAG: RHS repeat protein [Psychromonas sp.]|nr:RHS repeat protein [Psychromonas sp.]
MVPVLLGELNSFDVLLLQGELCTFQDVRIHAQQWKESTDLVMPRKHEDNISPVGIEKNIGKNTRGKGEAVNTAKINKSCSTDAFRGDMISMLIGEYILSQQDFQLNGLMSINWTRLYRSSKIKVDVGLGYGWTHHYSAQLHERYTPPPKVGPKVLGHHWMEFIDQYGDSFTFDRMKLGETSHHASTGLALLFARSDCYILIHPNEGYWNFNKINDQWLLTTINNDMGSALQLSYDNKNLLTRISCSPRRGITLFYNSMDHIIRIVPHIIDEEGQEKLLPEPLACYQFNLSGTLIIATDSNNITERYKYLACGLLDKRILASGFCHYFEWLGDDENAKCRQQWGDTGAYHYTFDYDGNKSSRTDVLGHTEFYYHDDNGLLTRFINARGYQTTYQYDAQNRKIQQINAQNQITRFIYNDAGKLTEQIETDGSKEQFLYNNFDKHIMTTDALGRKFKRHFTPSGRLLSETNPEGRKAYLKYNDKGLLSKKIDINGICTELQWSDQGDLLAQKVADKITRYSYDGLGRLNAVCDAQNLTIEYCRNKSGQIVEQHTYQQGRKDAKMSRYEYDKSGRLSVLQDTLGHITYYDYAGLSQPNKITFADGSWVKYQYDNHLNLTNIERCDEANYYIKYSPTQQPTQITGFDGRVQHYQYDELDNLISIKDGKDRLVEFRRNKRGQIVDQHAVKTNVQCNFNHHNVYQYDKLGRVKLAYNSDCKIELVYHRNGKISQSKHDHHRFNYNYDRQGQRSCIMLPDSSLLHYQYDKNGLLRQINLSLSSGMKQRVLNLNYNSLKLPTKLHQGNGLLLEQAFDAQSCLIEQRWESKTQNSPANSVYLQQRRYSYNALNQLVKSNELLRVNESSKSIEHSYTYNVLRQLIRCDVTDPTQSDSNKKCNSKVYSWSAFGDPQGIYTLDTKQQEVCIEHDRLISFKGRDYIYDGCGNQIKSTAAGYLQNRSFNGLNQLCYINVNGKLSHYHYDALGRRSAKITEAGKIEYMWDGNQLIGEFSKGAYRWYIYHPDTFLPIALIDQGEVYYYHLDQLGTPIYLTDKNQQIVWQNNSDVFGCELDSKECTIQNKINNPLRFQGQYFDVESSLHYNRFRYYCSHQERFIQQNPIGLAGGINLYQYLADPVNWIVPFGL